MELKFFDKYCFIIIFHKQTLYKHIRLTSDANIFFVSYLYKHFPNIKILKKNKELLRLQSKQKSKHSFSSIASIGKPWINFPNSDSEFKSTSNPGSGNTCLISALSNNL